MPYLAIRTNLAVAPQDRRELLLQASRAVSRMLGKPESYVMVSLHPDTPLVFAGSDAPAAYLELKSIGLPRDRTPQLSRALCDLLHARLGLAAERVYVEFSDAQGPLWGWNGETF